MIGDGDRPQAAILQSMGKVFDGLAPQNSGHPGGVGYLGSDALHLVSDCLHELFGPRGKRRPHVAPYRHHMRRDRKGRLQRNVGLRVGSHLSATTGCVLLARELLNRTTLWSNEVQGSFDMSYLHGSSGSLGKRVID